MISLSRHRPEQAAMAWFSPQAEFWNPASSRGVRIARTTDTVAEFISRPANNRYGNRPKESLN
jgi:hypothetical protein